MITLRLNSFDDSEIEELINRLNVINPESTPRCALVTCEKCTIKHLCYSISRAVEYAQAYLDGRESK